MAEFVKELPAQGRRPGRPPLSVYTDFAAELRRNRRKWAKWPKTYKSTSAANAVAYNIRNGLDSAPPAFRTGRWESKIRQGEIYVRFIGR